MAFPPLTDAMVETIRAYASEVTKPAGISIFTCGERGTDMFVVLEGNVNIYTGAGENSTETVIDLGHHQFTGELYMLNDQPTLVGARTTVPSLLLRVTRGDVQRLMRAEGEIANLILQAFIWRRIGLAFQAKVGVTLIGDEGKAETLKLQGFLRRNGYPHQVASVEAYKTSSTHPTPTGFASGVTRLQKRLCSCLLRRLPAYLPSNRHMPPLLLVRVSQSDDAG